MGIISQSVFIMLIKRLFRRIVIHHFIITLDTSSSQPLPKVVMYILSISRNVDIIICSSIPIFTFRSVPEKYVFSISAFIYFFILQSGSRSSRFTRPSCIDSRNKYSRPSIFYPSDSLVAIDPNTYVTPPV